MSWRSVMWASPEGSTSTSVRLKTTTRSASPFAPDVPARSMRARSSSSVVGAGGSWARALVAASAARLRISSTVKGSGLAWRMSAPAPAGVFS